MAPGDTVPPHQEIMRRLGASERSVIWALDQLRRQGIILRRHGARTVIAGEGVGEQTRPNGSRPQRAEATAVGVDSRTVIAIAEPDGGIFDQALQVLVKQAKAAKLSVHCRLMPREESEDFQVPPRGNGPCGYVLFRRQFLPLAERLQAEGHRVVFVGTPYADCSTEVPNVFGDQEHGGYLAVKHLLDLGHRRIAFHFTTDYLQLRRWAGCQRALNEAREVGLDVQSQMLEVAYVGRDQDEVAQWRNEPQAVRDYFERSDAPTAIVSWNDDMAVKMLTLLQRAGVRVPEDVSLVGYDNLDRGAEVHPALTTLDGALDTQIQAALRWLSQPNQVPKNQSIMVTPTIVRRDSSAPVSAQSSH